MLKKLYDFYRVISVFVLPFLLITLIALFVATKMMNTKWDGIWMAFQGKEKQDKVVYVERPMADEQRRLADAQRIAEEDLARRKKVLEDRELVLSNRELDLRRREEALDSEKKLFEDETSAFNKLKTDWEGRLTDQIFRTTLSWLSTLDAKDVAAFLVKLEDIQVSKYMYALKPALAGEVLKALPDVYTAELKEMKDEQGRPIPADEIKLRVNKKIKTLFESLPKSSLKVGAE